ncbi:MAG: molybdopterin-dependent oxidoreductase [Desulfobacteraceae bacterium]|nr:molybdopterin-dependent oxidoreductase [Desulfobacteraceae bacterium]
MTKIKRGDPHEVTMVNTVCNMCTNHCGINLYVQDGKVVNVDGLPEHPLHRLCVKPGAIPEFVHHRDRLTDPLKKENGKFRKISWDEAFGFIADKLNHIKKNYGAQAVDIHTGNPWIATQTEKVIRRFADVYGTPNYTSGGGYCFLAKVIASALTVGGLIAPYTAEGAKCMLIWGKNPTETFASEIDVINSNLITGSKLIVVDPKSTSLAKHAHIHAQVRPGTDCALALGLLHVIINENIYDVDFVNEWTIGFNELVDQVKAYTPEKVEEITWVPATTVRKTARMYAATKPACTSLGVSMDHSSNGIQAIRAISVLCAITGNLDVKGGSIICNPGIVQKNLRIVDRIVKEKPVGDAYPLFRRFTTETHVIPLIDAMVTEEPYPIKGFLCVGCNPAVSWPNHNKFKKGISNLDLFVVVDIFMTPTARMADIVLPGTTPYEREDIRDAYHTHESISLFVKTNKAIEPIGNSMTDWKIWADLGKRMGYQEYFPWNSTRQLMADLLEPTGLSLEQLEENPGGIVYMEKEYQRYLRDGFNTPSKKVEIYSKELKRLGYEPLPTFHEPLESPFSRTDLAKEYPLVFTTGARSRAYLHSGYRNIRKLRKLCPDPLVDIHPETAKNLGIVNRDKVTVESPRGRIRILTNVTEDVHPKVVSIQMGWSKANANVLTDDKRQDPVSGFPELRAGLCRIHK